MSTCCLRDIDHLCLTFLAGCCIYVWRCSSCACAQWLKAWCACAQDMVVLVDLFVFVPAVMAAIAIVQRNRHVLRLRTRPCGRHHRATQLACHALVHEAISLLPSCDATGMSRIVVAIVQHDRHVVRLRTKPYCCHPSGHMMYEDLSLTMLTSLP